MATQNLHRTDHVAHVKECAFYGVTPLTGAQIVKMHTEGFYRLSHAYSIAVDLANGFTWKEAVDALRRAEKEHQ